MGRRDITFQEGRIPWNKGKTKYTDLRIAAYGKKTIGKHKFQDHSKQGYLPGDKLPKLEESTNLSELIGYILGDGHISQFSRTEQVSISCHADSQDQIEHICKLMTTIFNRKPSIRPRRAKKCIEISFYQNRLSERLSIPSGNKIRNKVRVPDWIKKRDDFLISCLKGLFESDGSYINYPQNYYKAIEFSNRCSELLFDVQTALCKLGFHPQLGKRYVRLARKLEVESFKKLIEFRKY